MLAAPFKFKKTSIFFHSCHKKWESFTSHKSLSSLPFLYTKILIKFKNWLKMFIFGLFQLWFINIFLFSYQSNPFILEKVGAPLGWQFPASPRKWGGKCHQRQLNGAVLFAIPNLFLAPKKVGNEVEKKRFIGRWREFIRKNQS